MSMFIIYLHNLNHYNARKANIVLPFGRRLPKFGLRGQIIIIIIIIIKK